MRSGIIGTAIYRRSPQAAKRKGARFTCSRHPDRQAPYMVRWKRTESMYREFEYRRACPDCAREFLATYPGAMIEPEVRRELKAAHRR